MKRWNHILAGAAIVGMSVSMACAQIPQRQERGSVTVEEDVERPGDQFIRQKHIIVRDAPDRWERPIVGVRLPDRPREKGAFVGISVSLPSPALREQLKLPKGTGLVVDVIHPKSPAEEAGLKQHDVITKLNDQLLINPEQFIVLVRTFKPGDEVILSIVRGGEPTTVKTKLVERDLEPLEDVLIGAGGFGTINLRHDGPGPVPFQIPLPDPQMMRGGPPPMKLEAEGVSVWSDGKHNLTINTSRRHGRHLTATDSDGNTIFDGPINTPEDRAQIPPEIAEKLKRLEQQSPPPPPVPGRRVEPREREEPDAPQPPPRDRAEDGKQI